MDEWLGYHWLGADGRLRFPPHEAVEVGRKLTWEGPIESCRSGYHASRRALDALQYSPGPVACRVRLSGEILGDTDKSVATEWTCLAMGDATATLHEFACRCAEAALARERAAGREPNPRSWRAIEAKRARLRGEAADGNLAAAGEAAWAAAWEAAGAAAWEAAGAAAWEAAEDASRAAVWAAARDEAWDEQNRWLEGMLDELWARGS